MTLIELKRTVDQLSMEEKLELDAYIRHSICVDDPEWQRELGRRLDGCLQGKGHTAEELSALHETLCARELGAS